jgi:hypothetical protein
MLKSPSSLKWLIEKRGRVDGSIQKIELYLNKHRRAFEKYQELANELYLLRETLASIDTTLRLHILSIRIGIATDLHLTIDVNAHFNLVTHLHSKLAM